ncbi:RagB/SusD family nutrient uptake outer membrane protein [termite gut metagenome]|uniref:RagB/SusD family nutrient uptake outer membrane protein n=1 Tax=termite gut metagenome TaxID=433724 RepID=A0A5J4RQ42_9ZZZZ
MRKINSIVLLLLVIASGCSDFLKEDNKGGITNEELYSTDVGYQTLVTASYAAMRDIYGTTPWVIVGGTDLYQISKPNDHLAFYRYEMYPSNTDVSDFYANCYKSIQTVNMALYYNNLPNIDDALKKQYKSELQFLRAFYHFLLLEQFGGIAINDEVTLSVKNNFPRKSLADSYDFIIKEMKESLDGLKANAISRVNPDVVNHYLAKVYLTRAWDLGNSEDFVTAKQYAQKVINSRGEITLGYEDLWSPDNENNSEILFAVQYDRNSVANLSSMGNTQQALFCPSLGNAAIKQKHTFDQLVVGWNVLKWYDENDKRYNASFMEILYEEYFDYYDVADKSKLKVRAYYPRLWGSDYTQTDLDAWLADRDTVPGVRFICYPFPENDEPKYSANKQSDLYSIPLKKFDSPKTRTESVSSTEASVRDIVLARLGETYFLYAEACIGLNDFTSAKESVQKVLDRPENAKSGTISNALSVVSNQQEALHAYLKESGKEFIGEYNGRWAELRRTKMLKFMLETYNYDIKQQKLQGITFDFDNMYNLRPIPEDAITLNEALSFENQNAGY